MGNRPPTRAAGSTTWKAAKGHICTTHVLAYMHCNHPGGLWETPIAPKDTCVVLNDQ